MSKPILTEKPNILIPTLSLQERLQELAQQINQDFQDQEVTVVCVLKGSFIFFSDMIRLFTFPMNCEFLGVTHYKNQLQTSISGEVNIHLDIHEPLENRHVLILEDVIDSGYTLRYIQNTLRARNPAQLKTCALLMKSHALQLQPEVDYIGFKLGTEFVVGYGIDFEGQYRDLPYVGFLEHEH